MLKIKGRQSAYLVGRNYFLLPEQDSDHENAVYNKTGNK